jgi:hypothetical protein
MAGDSNRPKCLICQSATNSTNDSFRSVAKATAIFGENKRRRVNANKLRIKNSRKGK